MDKITQNYRKFELAKVDTEYAETKTKIKIIKPNGETKWLDIENFEFDAIAKILAGESFVYTPPAAKKLQRQRFGLGAGTSFRPKKN